MNKNALFKEFTFRNLHLKNRILMAPMTRSFCPNGIPTQEVAEYYERRADSVGLLITEGTVVNRPASTTSPNIPHFYGEEALEGWKRVVEKVHAKGGKIAPQLWHMGVVKYVDGWKPSKPVEGPSGYIDPQTIYGVEMTEEDIENTIEAFAQAAKDTKKLGFDALEIHGAHGYLIDQFFWDKLNKRTDKWGGKTIAERNRFAVELVKAIRRAVGDEFPVILRLSQWKQVDYSVKLAYNQSELEEWLLPLSEAGVDIFHCSQRRFWEPEFEGSNLNFAGWAKKITKKPSITVGSVGLSGEFVKSFEGELSHPNSLDNLIERLENDEFDLVAVGRALLADPNWVTKIEQEQTDQLKGFNKEYLAELY